jgi:hypothetical protein
MGATQTRHHHPTARQEGPPKLIKIKSMRRFLLEPFNGEGDARRGRFRAPCVASPHQPLSPKAGPRPLGR